MSIKSALPIKKDLFSGRGTLRCLILILLSFFLTSSGYLSWLYHLMTFVPAPSADLLSMCAGYSMQALGVLFFALIAYRTPSFIGRNLFAVFTASFIICLIPSAMGTTLAGTVIFGLLMNAACGLIAGYYLHALTVRARETSRAMVFGVGYGISVILSWILSLIGDGRFLRSGYVLILYIALALAAIRYADLAADEPEGGPAEDTAGNPEGSLESGLADEPANPEKLSGQTFTQPPLRRRTILLVCVTVFLMCLVKNIGFAFPSSDLKSGLSLELSRLLYAAGLITAGFVSDRNRKYGAVCTLAALVTPFIMLALSGESVPHMILWCTDYFTYGFFSVYRVILFSDMAKQNDSLHLAGLGLLFGRLGDALGIAVYHLLGGRIVPLIIIAALLFVVTVFLFAQLYQALYVPAAAVRKTERELFEQFSIRHDLSAREQEVFRCLLEGSTNAEIAQKLFVSESTVKFHVHNLLQKTGASSRAQLKTKYAQHRAAQ